MPHHARIVPVRLREYDAGLQVETLRIVGYRLVCSCGWRSPVEVSVRLARTRKREHVS